MWKPMEDGFHPLTIFILDSCLVPFFIPIFEPNSLPKKKKKFVLNLYLGIKAKEVPYIIIDYTLPFRPLVPIYSFIRLFRYILNQGDGFTVT